MFFAFPFSNCESSLLCHQFSTYFFHEIYLTCFFFFPLSGKFPPLQWPLNILSPTLLSHIWLHIGKDQIFIFFFYFLLQVSVCSWKLAIKEKIQSGRKLRRVTLCTSLPSPALWDVWLSCITHPWHRTMKWILYAGKNSTLLKACCDSRKIRR